ncbi:porin [Paraburkholderia guartelaensis]|uniref:porin n=1 Tax=Paraburkholderia guartelaensis TaxID=2546446 RepID=UPI002AB7820D|nr:porin [Paraburkholderia guartelaensis]
MKKTQCKISGQAAILALLATCGAAHAQSSVTLYGAADAALLYTNKTLGANGANTGSQFSVVDSGLNSSRFGMRGSEDLGGGLRANFDLESGINVANGGLNDSNGNFFGRQAWISLAGRFGEVKAGLQYSPFLYAIDESDPRGFSDFGSGAITYVDNVIATGLFNSNAVSYTSPELAGFTARAMLALGGVAGDFQAGRQYSFGLKYEHGGLAINAAMYDGNSGGAQPTPVPSDIEFLGRTLGVSYTFGSITAKASFTNYKVAGSFNNNVIAGGLNYSVTPALTVNGGVWWSSDRNQTSNNSVLGAIGAQYYLSKATALYAQAAIVHNNGKMDTGLAINGALYGVEGTTLGANVGIRHFF